MHVQQGPTRFPSRTSSLPPVAQSAAICCPRLMLELPTKPCGRALSRGGGAHVPTTHLPGNTDAFIHAPRSQFHRLPSCHIQHTSGRIFIISSPSAPPTLRMCIFTQIRLYVAELPLEPGPGGFDIHLNHHRSQNGPPSAGRSSAG